jgi:glycosyltransferase involved in cell wall biosynthesis
MVITTTSYNRGYLEKRIGIPSDKIVVIPPAIDPTRFRPLEHPTPDRRIILNVARLDRKKGHDILLKACLCLKNLKMPFECNIIGDGPERSNLLRLIGSLGLDSHVHLLGAKTNAEVLPYYQEASVFVMPSLLEALGVAAMEAMACKVPVVASRVGGVPELVEDGRTGFLVEVGHHEEFARKMALLLENTELRGRMGREARSKIVESFDINEQVRKLAQTLGYL